MSRLAERRLRGSSAPDELGAEQRAWEVARSVYAGRTVVARRRPRARLALLPAATILAAVLALTPAGAAVHRWIDQTIGVKHAKPVLFSLPAPGQILVAGHGGAWAISPDGSRRRLGSWSDATWSPRALYVAVAGRDQLIALNRRGVAQWSIARPDVRLPRWFGPNGYRVAYLSGSNLRVIAGDGTGDRLLAASVAPVAPAWRSTHAYQLAYTRTDGTLIVRDADSGLVAWSRQVQPRPRGLAWSADGGRLLVLTSKAALVYDGTGRLLDRVSSGAELRAGALSPDGRRLAVLSGSAVTITQVGRGGAQTVFSGAGLRQLAWSPDGQWLLVGWPAANQWVFIHAIGRPRILAVSRIAQQFGSFPAIEGWCCTAVGASG